MTEPMKPWEKVCPWCSGDRDAFCGKGCPGACHGTGVVPMTTDEMLETLAARGGITLSYIMDGDWMAAMTSNPADEQYARTPADALRAALEAVSG